MHIFLKMKGACFQPDEPPFFVKEAWRAISERYTSWQMVAPLAGMWEISKLPSKKYVLQVQHFADRNCVLLFEGKVWLRFNCVGPGLVEQWADEQEMWE